jgi:hypothetical protein
MLLEYQSAPLKPPKVVSRLVSNPPPNPIKIFHSSKIPKMFLVTKKIKNKNIF